jgi:hypothetical protein
LQLKPTATIGVMRQVIVSIIALSIIVAAGAIVQRRTNRDDALSPETKQEIARKQWLAVAWDFKQRLENYLIQHPSECGMHDPFGFTITCFKRSTGSQQATADITGGIQTSTSAHTTMDLHLRVALIRFLPMSWDCSPVMSCQLDRRLQSLIVVRFGMAQVAALKMRIISGALSFMPIIAVGPTLSFL